MGKTNKTNTNEGKRKLGVRNDVSSDRVSSQNSQVKRARVNGPESDLDQGHDNAEFDQYDQLNSQGNTLYGSLTDVTINNNANAVLNSASSNYRRTRSGKVFKIVQNQNANRSMHKNKVHNSDEFEFPVSGETDEFGDGDDGVRIDVNQSEEEEFVDSEVDEDDGDFVGENNSPDPEISWKESRQVDYDRQCRDDPNFKKYLDQLISKRVAEDCQIRKKKGKSKIDNLAKPVANDPEQGFETPKSQPHVDSVIRPIRLTEKIKSPSDTTLYTPALMKSKQNQNVIDQISNFVEEIRRRSCDGDKVPPPMPQSQSVQQDQPSTSGVGQDRRKVVTSMVSAPVDEHHQYDRTPVQHHTSSHQAEKRVCEFTDKILVQAEQFKATLSAPRGNNQFDYIKQNFVQNNCLAPIDEEVRMMRILDDDDEFFHITSHIDAGIKSKIEKGEYIDLERLLPKERCLGNRTDSDSKPLQLFLKGGQTYVAPSTSKEGKITGIKKWDQAFRVYAAIFTEANPGRSGEIWQYIHAIHTAAASYNWDSVMFYDITFCELMESKPWRSWGKTYVQGWNLALRANNGFGNNSSNSSFGSQNRGNNYNNSYNSRYKDKDAWKDDCCWRYNHKGCKKTSSECSWDHRCTYCAGWNHSYSNCRKRLGKSNPAGQNQQGTSQQQQQQPGNKVVNVANKKQEGN